MRGWRIPLSINVERVELALAQKGIEVEWVDVDPEERSPVVEVSGQSRVPVLEDDDGRVVAGSTEILEHLDRLLPEPPLYPADPVGARARLFVDWFERVWNPTAAAIEDELVGAAPNPSRSRIDELEARLVRALDLFEGLLQGGDFLLGDRLTAADCVAFPFVKYAHLGLPPGDDKVFHRIVSEYQPLGNNHPLVIAWIERVDALPRR